MTDSRELYQQVILDHNRAPRNFKKIDAPDREAKGHNPLCGDSITVYLNLDGDVITDVAFQGSGCAISKASTSLMTDAVKGKTTSEAKALFEQFRAMVTGGARSSDRKVLGKLAAFGGVREFPARVKCATLSWHTLKAALEQADVPATTE